MSDFADEVIEAPLIPTVEFIDANRIDFVTHGSDWTEQSVERYYGDIRRAGKLRIVPSTPGISTTQIIREVVNRRDLWENM
jgi:ethanolamine-phosphate cytidylyltransferase